MDYDHMYQKICQCNTDPIVLGTHNGKYKFYYKKQVAVDLIDARYPLSQLIELANNDIENLGVSAFEYQSNYDMAQFVKTNLIYHSIKNIGIIKPFLLQQQGNRFETVTGCTRRRALSLLPEITHVSAILCLYSDTQVDDTYIEIKNFNDFCSVVDEATTGTHVWFRVAAPESDLGLDWFEISIDNDTGLVGPEFRTQCILKIKEYLARQSNTFRFSTAWFTEHHNW